MSHPLPTVVVALVTSNSEALLPACLSSLATATAGRGPYRLVVADNASTDDSVALVEELHPGATIVRLDRDRGYAAGVNAAIDAAPAADAVLVLKPDIRLAGGSVRLLLDALATPGTGIAVPTLVDADGRLQPTAGRATGGPRAGRFSLLGETVTRGEPDARSGLAGGATAAVMLISRRCLDAVGRWDESFLLYSEETDFALRARDAGYALRYVPEAVAVHLGGDETSSSSLWSLLTFNRARRPRRAHGWVATSAVLGALFAAAALRSVDGPSRDGGAVRIPLGHRPPRSGAGRRDADDQRSCAAPHLAGGDRDASGHVLAVDDLTWRRKRQRAVRPGQRRGRPRSGIDVALAAARRQQSSGRQDRQPPPDAPRVRPLPIRGAHRPLLVGRQDADVRLAPVVPLRLPAVVRFRLREPADDPRRGVGGGGAQVLPMNDRVRVDRHPVFGDPRPEALVLVRGGAAGGGPGVRRPARRSPPDGTPS